MKQLHKAINQFETMLKKYPDKVENTYEFYAFFRSLQRMNTNFDYVPFIELGTIFKHNKPLIFHELRNYAGHSQVIELITETEMSLTDATEKINYIKGLKHV